MPSYLLALITMPCGKDIIDKTAMDQKMRQLCKKIQLRKIIKIKSEKTKPFKANACITVSVQIMNFRLKKQKKIRVISFQNIFTKEIFFNWNI